jgi:hypothetical protein
VRPDYNYLNALKAMAYGQKNMRLFWATNLLIIELLREPDAICDATIRDYNEAKRKEPRR